MDLSVVVATSAYKTAEETCTKNVEHLFSVTLHMQDQPSIINILI